MCEVLAELRSARRRREAEKGERESSPAGELGVGGCELGRKEEEGRGFYTRASTMRVAGSGSGARQHGECDERRGRRGNGRPRVVRDTATRAAQLVHARVSVIGLRAVTRDDDDHWVLSSTRELWFGVDFVETGYGRLRGYASVAGCVCTS